MRSIAIWYSPNNVTKGIDSVELHFNLWKVPSSNNSHKRFIDIGIKLDRTDCMQELKIYLPVILNKSDVSDLVSEFINDNKLVCAIFNENFKTKTLPNSKTYQILNQTDQLQFDVYSLDDGDFTVDNKYEGSIIKIIPPKTSNKTYFRIRIGHQYCESIVSIHNPSNTFIQSAFSKIELTDFRVNEIRDLNPSLLEIMNNESQLTISKGHFFYMISSNEDIINSHIPFINCRNLEKDKWEGYIDNTTVKWTDTILAYHWKVKEMSSFSILIKSKFESNNWKTIVKYLTVLFLLSVIFNLISSIIFKYFFQ